MGEEMKRSGWLLNTLAALGNFGRRSCLALPVCIFFLFFIIFLFSQMHVMLFTKLI